MLSFGANVIAVDFSSAIYANHRNNFESVKAGNLLCIRGDVFELPIENQSFDIVGRKTVSLGIAEFQENDSITTIFKKADVALYNAKTSGKNETIIKVPSREIINTKKAFYSELEEMFYENP